MWENWMVISTKPICGKLNCRSAGSGSEILLLNSSSVNVADQIWNCSRMSFEHQTRCRRNLGHSFPVELSETNREWFEWILSFTWCYETYSVIYKIYFENRKCPGTCGTGTKTVFMFKQHFSIKLILDNIMFFSIFSLLECINPNLGTLCSCSLCFHEENFSGTKVNTGHLNCFSYSGLL